jgi:hypothetical protein
LLQYNSSKERYRKWFSLDFSVIHTFNTFIGPMGNFTPDDLLLYLYNETTPTQAAAIKAALENDWTLREKYEVLKASTESMNQPLLKPGKRAVSNILAYAQEAVSDKVPQ